MKVARIVFATATTTVFATALVKMRNAIGGEDRQAVTEDEFYKAVGVAGVLTAGIWMCALGRR